MPTVETNGIETYYEEYGSGAPIVVLHGANANHQVWAEQLQPLTDEYRVILYDLRGHGKTGGSDRETYTVELYADDLAAFIGALDLDTPTILGHSWGGMIGYRFAVKYPESLAALVTVGSMTSHTQSKREWGYTSVFMRLVAPVMGNERIMNGVTWLLTRIFGEDASGDLDENERLRNAHHCDVPDIQPSERSKILDAVLDYYGSARPLHEITVPVLMMYAENELPFLEHHADYLKTHLDQCQTAEIPDAGHNAQADNPAFIRDQLREFMTTQVPEPPAKPA